jgi:nickel/cobalt transporter (NicO) family protein
MKTIAFALLLLPALALAHPLGNFTTNRWTRLTVGHDAIEVRWVVDMAELPTLRELAAADRDDDGGIDDAWVQSRVADVVQELVLERDGARLALAVVSSDAALRPGAGGMRTLRLDVTYRAALPALAGTVVFRDAAYAGRPGWQEIVAVAADGVVLRDASVPSDDLSDALRAYPDDLLATPPQVREARFTMAAGGASPAGPTTRAGTVRAGAERFGDRFTALVTDPAPLGPAAIAGALLVAAMLGAFHALTPGHGKTIVGAYLIGSQGTAWHAVFLGLVVTATHTLGVYVLGLATLAASTWVVPERLFPWMSMISGLLVVGVGARLLASRLDHAHHHHHHHHDHDHDHHHGHSHLPPAGAPVTLGSLTALGVSGGLLPCPSALVVMLGAIAVGRTAFGLVLILAFSTGLAAVLTAIGLVLVYARGLFERLPLDGRFARWAPVASALVISLAGVAVVVDALGRIGGS